MNSAKCIAPVLLLSCAISANSYAASHREAPQIAFDPAADNTDTYAFVSYDAENLARSPEDRKITFIMNVNPGQDPADGPNYFNFSDEVLYRIHIDNEEDGLSNDVVYEFRFHTETRPFGGALTGPIPAIGNPNIPVSALRGITALDGDGSEGLTRRQTYTVTEVRHGKRRKLFAGETLVAVPSNSGPATFPDYEDLASQGIYEDNGVRVFAGQRAETFYIDLGAVFDTVNLRRFPPILTEAEDADDGADPFGVNRFSGSNVSTIAIEVPIAHITEDGLSGAATRFPVLGMYASTSRQQITKLRTRGRRSNSGHHVQVSRLANPLVNELILDTPFKDRWNSESPHKEARFEEFYKNPTVATELELIFGVPATQGPRNDLMQLLLKYPGQSLRETTKRGTRCGYPCAELLRVDVSVEPTPADSQQRLGAALSSDPAGFPNGRRPNDDVTDIVTRVAGGKNYIDNRVGDGVNYLADAPGIGTDDGAGYGAVPGNRLDVTDNGIAKEFPFLPTPHDGRNRQHIDCDEDGANACN